MVWLGHDKSLEVSVGLCRLLRQHKKKQLKGPTVLKVFIAPIWN